MCFETVDTSLFEQQLAQNPEHARASVITRPLGYGWKRYTITKCSECAWSFNNIKSSSLLQQSALLQALIPGLSMSHKTPVKANYPASLDNFSVQNTTWLKKMFLFLGERPEPWIQMHGLGITSTSSDVWSQKAVTD